MVSGRNELLSGFLILSEAVEKASDIILSQMSETKSEETYLVDGTEAFHCLSPSDSEMLFYDILYDPCESLTGFELRIFDDSVRAKCRAETNGFATVEWNMFPRVWLTACRQGTPKSFTTELFGDLQLCRSDNGKWAIILKLDDPLLKSILT